MPKRRPLATGAVEGGLACLANTPTALPASDDVLLAPAGVLVLLVVVVDAATGLRVANRLALSHAESSSSEETITRGEKLPLSSASPRLGVELCVVGEEGKEHEFGRGGVGGGGGGSGGG